MAVSANDDAGKGAPRWLPSTRWVAWLANVVNANVRRRTVIIFIVIEAIISILTMAFFATFSSVGNLALIFHSWKSQIVMLTFRILCGIFGVVVVWQRGIRRTRFYYGLFMLNFVLGSLTLIPLFNVRCECTDYQSCFTLQDFASDDKTPLNPFPPPPDTQLRNERRMVYEEMPEAGAVHTDDEAGAGDEDDSDDGSADDDHPAPSLLQRGGGSVSVSVTSRATGHHESQIRKRGRHRALPEHRLDPAPALLEATESSNTIAPEKPRVLQEKPKVVPVKPEVQATPGRRSFDRWKKWDRETQGLSPLHFFNITRQDIFWKGTGADSCKSEELNHADAEIAGRKLKAIRQDPDAAELGVGLVSQLWLCIHDPLCGAIASTVYLDDDHKWRFDICMKAAAAVPIKGERKNPTETHVFFQRNPVVIRSDLVSMGPGSDGQLSGEIIKRTRPAEGMDLLGEMIEGGCTCKESEDSCRLHTDGTNKDHYWCWVSARRKATCMEQGISIHRDPKTGKFWSEELCQRASCKCSHIGMLAPPGVTNPRKSLLWENGLNYGRSCMNWDVDGKRAWCYVGFDSTCADRLKRLNAYGSNTTSDKVKSQFWSELPCNQGEQVDYLRASADKCVWLTKLMQALFVILYILSTPMFVVIFKFIQNRCGDQFKEEDHFAVVFSSEEEEEDDGDQQQGEWAEERQGAEGAGASATARTG